jgi:nucleotide-binding universal stress UspA family protein
MVMVEMRTLLAAIDFSDMSSLVMDYAHSLATAYKARVLAVHVVYDLSYFTGMYHDDTSLPELQHRLEVEAQERLEVLCQSAFGHEVSYEALVVTGPPLATIRSLIQAQAVDCLVLGAHSMDKPEHQLFGSTAERLLHYLACPIFVVPPRKSSEFVLQGKF